MHAATSNYRNTNTTHHDVNTSTTTTNTKSQHSNQKIANLTSDSVKNSFFYNKNSKFNLNATTKTTFTPVNTAPVKNTNNHNELDSYRGEVFDVKQQKFTEKSKMNCVYPTVMSSLSLNEQTNKSKYYQKSASPSSLLIMGSGGRYTKSARPTYDSRDNYSAHKSSRSSKTHADAAAKRVQTTSNPQRVRQQASINTVLCHQCLKYHLDKCNICFNESSMDDLDNEYYYKNAVESSGSCLFFLFGF